MSSFTSLSSAEKRVLFVSSGLTFSVFQYVSFQGLLAKIFLHHPEAAEEIIHSMSSRQLSLRELATLLTGTLVSLGLSSLIGGSVVALSRVLAHTQVSHSISSRLTLARRDFPKASRYGAIAGAGLFSLFAVPTDLPSPLGVALISAAHVIQRLPLNPLITHMIVSHGVGWFGIGLFGGTLLARGATMILVSPSFIKSKSKIGKVHKDDFDLRPSEVEEPPKTSVATPPPPNHDEMD